MQGMSSTEWSVYLQAANAARLRAACRRPDQERPPDPARPDSRMAQICEPEPAG
jgi:hypothetical protein